MITERILVVDDELTVCQSVAKILSRKGYEVENALSTEGAVQKMNSTSYGLVITDLMMPKSNGLELLQIVKDHYPELEVIMITGYASIESAVKATKLGAACYLPKPFTPDELTTAAEDALSRRRVKLETKARTGETPLPRTESDDIIDVDMPFKERELIEQTSKQYVDALTHSDIPLAKKTATKVFCNLGKRECRRLALEGRECVGECPLQKKEKARAKTITRVTRRSAEFIDVDLPFNAGDVERVTGPDYINCLTRSDIPLAALWGRDASAKHTVLVVDDEPIVCHSVRRILTKESCTVEEAFDVDSALLKMRINKYDLVILDLKMPKRNGMEVLRSIKSQWPQLPVIMVTGFASIEGAIEATKSGAANFIAKPFTPDELKQAAVEVLAA
jgi:DNA-binding NtrC family response regulator